MNTTQKMDAALTAQLAALGISIEEDTEPQVSNSKVAREEAKHLGPAVRAWLGATANRELFIARSRKDTTKKVKLNLQYFCESLGTKEALHFYFAQFIKNIAKGDQAKIQLAVDGLTFFNEQIRLAEEAGTKYALNKWTLIRAINSALRLSNYGNFMQKRGWIYTGDSDHKIIVTMLDGQYRWSEPEVFTIGTIDAETEDEYLKPYDVRDIPNPDNPDEVLKIRVYRRAGNVVHPSSTVTMEELERDDVLAKGLASLTPGASFSKRYDPELYVSEFERQAERDVDYVLDQATAQNVRLWPVIDLASKSVIVYHAGELDATN